MSLVASVTSSVSCRHTKTANGIEFFGNPSKTYSAAFTASDVTYVFQRASVSVDTTGTTYNVLSGLEDSYGDAIAMSSVKQVIVTHNGSSNTLTVGGGSNPVFSAAPGISAGGCLNLTSTFTVDATHCNIKLTASAGTISCDVLILGA